MLDKKVKSLLNTQINKELFSAYLYLGFANYYEDEGLSDFSNWYMVQAQEERDHAMLMLKYLQMNGETIELLAVEKPDQEFTDHMEPLKEALKHEQYVSRSFFAILRNNLCNAVGPYFPAICQLQHSDSLVRQNTFYNTGELGSHLNRLTIFSCRADTQTIGSIWQFIAVKILAVPLKGIESGIFRGQNNRC